ncbi:glycosyltransferase [Desulfallas sp. Bu1-1]|uniref:glycosyltransferase n=1 Tax=Desulfallas sp. Bu1-1 TaxID=2787620 RepID=UPI00189F3056|nr:glycosyltransferase [Desulfallas sp. Bu1-1]MBF7081425.1 glycosyltransferase [Desulfallas sp. Bu1-1]
MKHVLIITYSYAPAITPRAFRWAAIAEHWAGQGHHVDIVCAWMPGLPREEILNGVHIYRVGSTVSEVLRSRFGKPDAHPQTGRGKLTKGIISASLLRPASLAKWIHDRTWKKIYWPDYACLWYFPALKKVQQLVLKNRYDNLISVSHPFTGHLVGLGLKKKYPQLRWVVDIGDPFCFLEETPANNHQLYKSLNYSIERNIFRHADAVAVTTEPALEKYAGLFPESAGKIRVIPPLLSLVEDYAIENTRFPGDHKIRLAFIGTLYKTIRNPGFLLLLFEKLLQTHLADRLELHFLGDINNCRDCFKPYKTLLGTRIFLHSPVTHDKALEAMKNADVLVNIGNSTPYQLPSKLVEYASTGKSILNLAKTANDSSTAFLKSYSASLCLLENTTTLDANQLVNLIEFIEYPPQIDRLTLRRRLASFRIEVIAAAYEGLLTIKNRPVVLTTSNYYIPCYKGGGTIRTLANMVDRLGDEFSFKIITRDRDLGDFKPCPGILANCWQQVDKANVLYLSPQHSSLWKIRKVLRATEHDVLYINSFFSIDFTVKPLLLRRLGLIPKVPVILAPRGELSPGALALKGFKKRLFIIAAKLLGLYRGITWQASSEHEEKNIRNRFGDRIPVIIAPDLPPVVRLTHQEPYRRNKIKGFLNVIFLSRIARIKNLDGALKMLKSLQGKIQFNIYGPVEDPDYWAKCREIIDLLPGNIEVRYMGAVSHEHVVSVIKDHDLFFLPTRGENFGHVILEALIAGCPVLTSDQTPWRGLEDKGVGWDVPLDKPEVFQHVLQKCVDMDTQTHRKLSQRARAYGWQCSRAAKSLEQNRTLFLSVVRGVL